MNVTRTIPGRPFRNGTAVADSIADLIARTLDTSPHIVTDDVRTELDSLRPALALLASGGHLANGMLVLTAADLRLTITVPVGEAALKATEDTAAPRGAATATTWTLHLPGTGGLAGLAESAASMCAHVSTEPAPTDVARSSASTRTAGIDLARLLDGSDR